MNLFDATDAAEALLPRRWFRRLVLLVAMIVAALLATPLLSVDDVGAWTYDQAQQHVHELLDPLVEGLLDNLQPDLPATTSIPTTTLPAPPAGL